MEKEPFPGRLFAFVAALRGKDKKSARAFAMEPDGYGVELFHAPD